MDFLAPLLPIQGAANRTFFLTLGPPILHCSALVNQIAYGRRALSLPKWSSIVDFCYLKSDSIICCSKNDPLNSLTIEIFIMSLRAFSSQASE